MNGNKNNYVFNLNENDNNNIDFINRITSSLKNSLINIKEYLSNKSSSYSCLFIEESNLIKLISISNGDEIITSHNSILNNKQNLYKISDCHSEMLSLKCLKFFLIQNLVNFLKMEKENNIFEINKKTMAIQIKKNIKFHLLVSDYPCGCMLDNSIHIKDRCNMACEYKNDVKVKMKKSIKFSSSNIISCSDELMLQTILGCQGSFLYNFIGKVNLSSLIIIDNNYSKLNINQKENLIKSVSNNINPYLKNDEYPIDILNIKMRIPNIIITEMNFNQLGFSQNEKNEKQIKFNFNNQFYEIIDLQIGIREGQIQNNSSILNSYLYLYKRVSKISKFKYYDYIKEVIFLFGNRFLNKIKLYNQINFYDFMKLFTILSENLDEEEELYDKLKGSFDLMKLEIIEKENLFKKYIINVEKSINLINNWEISISNNYKNLKNLLFEIFLISK